MPLLRLQTQGCSAASALRGVSLHSHRWGRFVVSEGDGLQRWNFLQDEDKVIALSQRLDVNCSAKYIFCRKNASY